jgi:hypothetical protein
MLVMHSGRTAGCYSVTGHQAEMHAPSRLIGQTPAESRPAFDNLLRDD